MPTLTNEADLASLSDFREFLFQPLIPIDDLQDHEGEPLKVIVSYWRRKKLVTFLGEGRWLKLSFAQLIWVRMLDTLREFGYPVEKMVKVSDYFFDDANTHNLPQKNLLHNKRHLEQKRLAGTLDEREEETLYYIEQSLRQEPLLEGLKFSVNYLTNLLTSSLDNRLEGGIYIFRDGSVVERLGDRLFSHRTDKVDIKRPHLYLSLTHYLSAFIKDKDLSTLFFPQVLNEDEKIVLRELRNKNIDTLAIELKNGEVVEIKTSRSGVLTERQAEEIKTLLALGNYEGINLHTRDKKTIVFNRTKKKMIRRK